MRGAGEGRRHARLDQSPASTSQRFVTHPQDLNPGQAESQEDRPSRPKNGAIRPRPEISREEEVEIPASRVLGQRILSEHELRLPRNVHDDGLVRRVVRHPGEQSAGDDRVVPEVLDDLLVENRLHCHRERASVTRFKGKRLDYDRLPYRPCRVRCRREKQRDEHATEQNRSSPHHDLLLVSQPAGPLVA